MNFKNLLEGSYWFSQPAPALGGVEKVYLGILLGLVFAAIVVLIMRRRQTINAVRLVMLRYASLGFTMGITGLLLFWFRQERVFFLGWRVWYGIWFVILAIWLYKLLYYTFKRIPVIKAEHAERQQREKYLPKKL